MTAKLLGLAFNIILVALLISSIEKNNSRAAWLSFLVLLVGDMLFIVFLRWRLRTQPAEISSVEKFLLANQGPTIALNYVLAVGCIVAAVVGLVLASWRIVLLGLLGVAIAVSRVLVSRYLKSHFGRQK